MIKNEAGNGGLSKGIKPRFNQLIYFMSPLWKYIKHKKPCLTSFPNTDKRIKNTTCSEVCFDELWGVWTNDANTAEFQSKRKRKWKEEKNHNIYAN